MQKIHPRALRHAICRKDRVYKKYVKNGRRPEDWRNEKLAQNEITRIIKEAYKCKPHYASLLVVYKAETKKILMLKKARLLATLDLSNRFLVGRKM